MKVRLSAGYSQADPFERPVRHISRYSGKRVVSVQHQEWLEEVGLEIFQEPAMLSAPALCPKCKRLFDLRWHPESCKDHEGREALYDGLPLNTKTKFQIKREKQEIRNQDP